MIIVGLLFLAEKDSQQYQSLKLTGWEVDSAQWSEEGRCEYISDDTQFAKENGQEYAHQWNQENVGTKTIEHAVNPGVPLADIWWDLTQLVFRNLKVWVSDENLEEH